MSHISWWSMIVRVSVVPRRNVCGDIDWRFDNLSEFIIRVKPAGSDDVSVSQCHHKQSFSGVHSPRGSYFTDLWSWDGVVFQQTCTEFCFILISIPAFFKVEFIKFWLLTWEDCSSFGSQPVFLSQNLVQSILILIEFVKIHMGDHVISNHCSWYLFISQGAKMTSVTMHFCRLIIWGDTAHWCFWRHILKSIVSCLLQPYL